MKPTRKCKSLATLLPALQRTTKKIKKPNTTKRSKVAVINS